MFQIERIFKNSNEPSITHSIDYDIVALSVRFKKMREAGQWIDKLLSPQLPNHLESSDFVEANQIKNYYSKKLMTLALKEIQLTPFRKDLSTLVNSNGKTFDNKILPLAFKLPDFYEYDIQLDKVFNDIQFNHYQLKTNEHKHIGTLKKKNKLYNNFEYWFVNHNKIPVCVSIDEKNPLLNLWDNILNKNSILTLYGQEYTKSIDGTVYISMTKFMLG